MIGWLILAVVLFIISACLIVFEILLPSFGLLTVVSISSLAGGLTIFYHYDIFGTGLFIAAVTVPVTLFITYKKLPNSSFGKSILLKVDPKSPGQAVPDSDELKMLKGKDGTAITTMRPVGKCMISGQKYACLAEAGFIKKGTNIKVISVGSTEIVVRAIEDDMS